MFGETFIGSSHDISSAYDYLDDAVCNEGIFGLEYIKSSSTKIFNQRDLNVKDEQIDKCITENMNTCYAKAIEIINKYYKLFEKLVDSLIRDSFMTNDKIQEFMSDYFSKEGGNESI